MAYWKMVCRNIMTDTSRQIVLTEMSQGKGNVKIILVFQENGLLLYHVPMHQSKAKI